MMDGRAPTSRHRAAPGGSGPSAALRTFSAELASIAGLPAQAVSPESRLIADLGFDAHAFSVLAVLLFERYRGGAGPSPFGQADCEALTVRSVFEDYVLP